MMPNVSAPLSLRVPINTKCTIIIIYKGYHHYNAEISYYAFIILIIQHPQFVGEIGDTYNGRREIGTNTELNPILKIVVNVFLCIKLISFTFFFLYTI